MKIDFRDISVVIQGPIDWSMDERYFMPTTHALCSNIRNFMPGAEIILSTWDGQRHDGLDIDKVVGREDPGAQGAWPSFVPTNVNRQIIGTVAGLKASSRPYCLKCRSDMVLEGISFLDTYSALPQIHPDRRQIFDRPIVSNNLSSRNTSEILNRIPGHPLLFHPSDHIHFGLRKDLLSLWDIPLQSDEDGFFFLDRAQPNPWRYHELSRLTPEQFILTSAIAKKIPINFLHFAHSSPEMNELSQYYMSTHFAFVPDRAFPVHFAKYHTPHHFSFEWMRINPDPHAPKELKIRRDWRWRISFPFRDPAGFRRWLKRRVVAKVRQIRSRLGAT